MKPKCLVIWSVRLRMYRNVYVYCHTAQHEKKKEKKYPLLYFRNYISTTYRDNLNVSQFQWRFCFFSFSSTNAQHGPLWYFVQIVMINLI